MSRRNNGSSHMLDLKLNLSLPARGDNSRRMDAAEEDGESSPSSCVSSENEQSPEGPSMVLAACPQCFIYMLLSDVDPECPKCPRCKTAVILDFFGNGTASGTTKNKDIRKS